ncbi:MAG: hypothetical protein DMF63_05075 [Acidobacteria bacterium]|nr:MAG: hypothetical protein DMF63_05075 [Acidobacteriota bacterium]
MRYLLFTSILLSLFVFSADAQKKRPIKRKPPATVFTVKGDIDFKTEARPAPKAVSETSYTPVVENYVSAYVINADGTGSEQIEIQKRCSSDICVRANGVIRQIYNADLLKMKVLDASIVKADGTKTSVPASSITDRPTDQAEAAPGFSSMREMRVSFDGMKSGDATYLKVQTEIFRPSFDGKFDGLETFPVIYDWKSIRIDITAPTDLPLYIDASGLEGGKLAGEGNLSKWRYTKVGVSKIDREPAMDNIMAISPRIALTTSRDADALGSVFWEAIKKKAVVTPEIQTLADEITKDSPTPAQRASAIYDWVNKNIRYLSVILDRSGWIPHSSTEIIKNGYGDCKDYTTIIHTLLKAKGIDSIPVLIRADAGNWFPTVPTAHYFNHVILYIPSIDTFADATLPNTRLGLIPQALVGKTGLMSGEKTGIIHLPKDNPADNQILSDITLDFSSDGSVKGRSKNTYVGRSEIFFRPVFASVKGLPDTSYFVSRLLSYYGLQGDGEIIKIGDQSKLGDPFTVEYTMQLQNFTTFWPKGRLEIPPGMNMTSFAEVEVLTETETRNTSLTVGAMKFGESFEINVPTTVKITTPPPNVDFTNAVGSLSVSAELKNGSLRYRRELVFKKDIVEPAEYPLLKELVKKATALSTFSVEYTGDASLVGTTTSVVRSGVGSSPSKPPTRATSSEWSLPKKLTALDVQRMEKSLSAKPDDVDTRIKLIWHYSSTYDARNAVRLQDASVRHRIWLIEHHPEIEETRLLGFSRQDFSPASIDALKKAWMAKVAQSGTSEIRMNAIDALKSYAPDAARSLADEGVKLSPGEYKYLLTVVELNTGDASKTATKEQADEAARKVLDYGMRALVLLKKERSDDRDWYRFELLKNLSRAAIRLEDLDRASSFAQELVLDFGQASYTRTYDQAAHVGNTTLGLVELRRNNIAKAKDHLLASIRAPLRMGYNNLGKIDMSLAKAMFEKGEKNVVLEYLKLCQTLPNFKIYPESYADDVYALKLWIGQIEKGTTPNFDFGAAESHVPLSSGPNIKSSVKSHE